MTPAAAAAPAPERARASTAALPPGFHLRLDRSVRSYAGGRVLAGGAPARIMRLSDAGRTAVAALQADGDTSEAARTLGRRLVDAGMAHPLPPRATSVDATVVIPAHDRTGELDRCLAAIGDAVPVVVVDDGSGAAGEVAAVCGRHGATLIRRDACGGPAAARNAALPTVRTELVAFLDSDCTPEPGWLETLAAHFADPLVGAVAPRIAPETPSDTARTRVADDGPSLDAPSMPRDTARARFAAGRSPLDMGRFPDAVGPGERVPYVPTAALMVRSAALATAFDAELRYGEDVDFVWRLRDAGWCVRYEPAAQVAHAEPDTWRQLLRRRARYGTSAAPLARRHPGRLAPAVLRPRPTAAAALLLARRPAGVCAATAIPAVSLTRRMRAHGVPPSRAIAWSAGAVGHTLVGLSRATTILAAPVLIAGLVPKRTRFATAALLAAAPLEQWARRRPPLDPFRWTLACIADDAAYGLGVWQGCARERCVAPLIPAIRR